MLYLQWFRKKLAVYGLLFVVALAIVFWIASPWVSAQETPKPKPQEWQINGILAALDDGYPDVQGVALERLTIYDPTELQTVVKQPKQLAQKIANLLKNSEQNVHVRWKAIEAVGNLDQAAEPYLPELGKILKSKTEDSSIRWRAAESLSNFGDAAKPYISDIFNFIKDQKTDSSGTIASDIYILRNFGDAAKPYILDLGALLKDNTQALPVRAGAAIALSNFGNVAKPYIPDILNLLQDVREGTYTDERLEVGKALGNLGEVAKSYIPDLADLLKNRKQAPVTRISAAQALSNFGYLAKPHISDIADFLNDKTQSMNFRGEAALALCKFGELARPYVKDILNFLQEEIFVEPHIHIVSALREQNLANPSFPIQSIINLVRDKSNDPSIRANVVEALARLDKENARSHLKSYLSDFVALLNDRSDSPFVRVQAASVLGSLGTLAKPYVKDILNLFKDEAVYQTTYSNDRRLSTAESLSEIEQLDLGSSLIIFNRTYYAGQGELPTWRFLTYFLSGGNHEIRTLLKWLSLPDSQKIPTQLSHTKAQQTLDLFNQAWQTSKDLPRLRGDLAQRIADVARLGKWQPGDIALLEQHYKNLSDAKSNSADSVKAAIDSLTIWKWFNTAKTVIAIHLVFWVALIFLYPKFSNLQALFFWNPWVRTIAGLGYVSALLVTVPFLQRRLFAPFQNILRQAAGLDQFDPTAYFQESRVKRSLWSAGKETEATLLLTTAIPSLKGQMLLQAPSGFGKTMFLRHLIHQSPQRIIVFLTATECAQAKDRDVIQAIQAKLPIAASDPNFLKSLIYSGAIDIYIDGLNEINAEAQASIKQFLSSYTKGNIILTTQPLSDKNPPQSAKLYRLLPLDDDQISRFLISRHPEDAILQGEDYQQVCAAYLKEVLDPNQSPEDLTATRRILSNPMDLDTVAEMLAHQERPELFRLQQQQYDRMAAEYADNNNGFSFPLNPVAQLAYEMRLSDQHLLPKDRLSQEVINNLEKHRLLTPKSGSWQFRHDKIWDFFIVQKYLEDEQKAYAELKETERMRDTRLRGVYLQLATELDLAIAQALEKDLFDYASSTGDHITSDPFRKRLESRSKKSASTSFK